MREALEALRKAADNGEAAVLARIVEIEGFSTRPGDEIVAVDSAGSVHGTVLAGLAEDQLRAEAASLLAGKTGVPAAVTIDVGDRDAVSAGLACGGRAYMLLHRSSAIPAELWKLLESRAPAALLSRVAAEGTIVVDRESQKPIVVGRGGEMIKTIGTAAREELERFFGVRVFLDLHVRVRAGWREDDRVLGELGLGPRGADR